MKNLVRVGPVAALAVALILFGQSLNHSSGIVSTAAAPNEAPVADLALNPESGLAPLDVTADGSGSTDDVIVASYAFTWGDGTSTGPDVGAIADHTYESPGRYRITLTAKDNHGKSSSATKTVTVTRGTPGPNQAPVAAVTAVANPDAGSTSIEADASASTDDRKIRGYRFDFGDGSRTVFQPASSASHAYARAGTYTVSVTVRDGAGVTSLASTQVTTGVVTPPSPASSSPVSSSPDPTTPVSSSPEPSTPVSSSPEPTTPQARQAAGSRALAAKTTVVSFTFDDTFEEQTAAISSLHKYGLHGTLYVNSPRIGQADYLSKSELDGFQSAGDEIAGHTLNHKDLATISDADQKKEMCDDRTALMGMGYTATSFAYPFGSTGKNTEAIAKSCGYSSARGVGDLRSPGYGCNDCDTANTIPASDSFYVKTNQSVQSDTTLVMLENYVTQAENDQGGWVPLVFHHICSGCADNAIDPNTFDQFAQWMSQRPASTSVKTVAQVTGGPTAPPTAVPSPSGTSTVSPTTTPTTPANSVTVGTATHSLDGTNVARASNALVRYTPAFGASTKTNAYGFEATVVDGKVTKVADGVGNTAIPSNGYVLSGHGSSRTFLQTNAKVGTTVTLGGGASPSPTMTASPSPTVTASPSPTVTASPSPTVTASPSPTVTASPSPTVTASPSPTVTASPSPSPTPTVPPNAKNVTVAGQTHAVSGTNVGRGSNQLIVYTQAKGATTGTNSYGFEAAVVGGRVTQVADGVGNMAIPANGYVLSGHGTSRTFLKSYATVGATVTLS